MVAKFPGEALLAIEWTLIGVAFILVLLRLNLRLRSPRARPALCDCFILGAFASACSLTAVDTWLHGLKVYQADVNYRMDHWHPSGDDRIQVYKAFFSLYFPFYLEQYFNKGTLLSLYFCVFGQNSSKTRTCLFLLASYCITAFFVTVFMNLFFCRFGCYWSLDDPCPLSCTVIKDNMTWALHFSSDVFIFILPLVCIGRLDLSRTQRISAALTFGLGFVNISLTLARWFVVQSVFAPNPSLTVGEVLAISDGHLGLIVSILPTLAPYLRPSRRREHHHHHHHHLYQPGRHKRLASGASAASAVTSASSAPSIIRKETTTYQEISYTTENDKMLLAGLPEAFCDTRSVRTLISANDNAVPPHVSRAYSSPG